MRWQHGSTDPGRRSTPNGGIMGSVHDFAALHAMFAETAKNDSGQAATSYGRDAPVKVTGMTPGMIGPPKKSAPAKPAAKKKADPNAIWSESEVREAGDVDEIDDGRKQPEYDIVFKQNVTPEDFFLGVDPVRHPGISCSDELVLKVTLPETKLADIDLDVRPTFVRVSAPKYKLKAQLGERVDENKGNAKVRLIMLERVIARVRANEQPAQCARACRVVSVLAVGRR